MDLDLDHLVAAFADRTLAKAAWTHEAHVAVCWWTVRQTEPSDALDRLRTMIRSYNDATGTANTDHGGYHETLTRYYVDAVAVLAGRTLDDVLADPTCSRAAPLRHWSRERLFSVEARRRWVDPDLEPLPWVAAAACSDG